MALEVIDRAMQSFGAEGISQDTELAYHWAQLRTLRIADVCNKSAIGILADASALGTRCSTYPTSWTDRAQASICSGEEDPRNQDEREGINAEVWA